MQRASDIFLGHKKTAFNKQNNLDMTTKYKFGETYVAYKLAFNWLRATKMR